MSDYNPQDELFVRYLEGAASSDETREVERILREDESASARLVQLSELECFLNESGSETGGTLGRGGVVVDAVSAVERWQVIDTQRRSHRKILFACTTGVLIFFAATLGIVKWSTSKSFVVPAVPETGSIQVLAKDEGVTVTGKIGSKDGKITVSGEGMLKLEARKQGIIFTINAPSKLALPAGPVPDTIKELQLIEGSVDFSVPELPKDVPDFHIYVENPEPIDADTHGGKFEIFAGKKTATFTNKGGSSRTGRIKFKRVNYASVAEVSAGEIGVAEINQPKRVFPSALPRSTSRGDLLHKWRFNKKLVDERGGITVSSPPKNFQFSSGKIGPSLYLSGTSGLTTSEVVLPPRFSIEAWVRISGGRANHYHAIICNSEGGIKSDGFRVIVGDENDEGNASLWLETGNSHAGRKLRSRQNAFPLDHWVHVLVRIDRSNQEAEIWINGKNETSDSPLHQSVMPDFTLTAPLMIGQMKGEKLGLVGRIDELWISREQLPIGRP